MSFAPSSPVTGSPITGFTAPTYTIVTDIAPSINGKQYAVTGIGGTQTGVDSHSVSKPFTLTFFKPAVLKTLPQANPLTGVIKNVPINTWKLVFRKGAAPAANQSIMVPRLTVSIEVPAGVDTYEPEEIKAMISAAFGTLWANSAGIADSCITGIV